MKARLHAPRRPNRTKSFPVNLKTESKTVQELARARGAKPFDPQAFAGIVPPGEDIGAFVKEIYRARS